MGSGGPAGTADQVDNERRTDPLVTARAVEVNMVVSGERVSEQFVLQVKCGEPILA